MRLNELINPDTLKNGQMEWMLSSKGKALIEFMKVNCSEILNLYYMEEQGLYRGIRKYNSGIVMARTPIDRSPMDTPKEVDQKLDKILIEAGFKARRTNSIFCTSDAEFAVNYGDEFLIFPINGFDYSWCKSAKDLYNRFSLHRENNEFLKDMENLSPIEFVKKYDFKNNQGLGDAIEYGNEVCISGKYIAIRMGTEFSDVIENSLNLLF
jgi:hypothetical protein